MAYWSLDPPQIEYALYSVPGKLLYRSSGTSGGHIPSLSSASRGVLGILYVQSGSLPKRQAYYPEATLSTSVCDIQLLLEAIRTVCISLNVLPVWQQLISPVKSTR